MAIDESTREKRQYGYEKRPNDLITAKECALIIRGELQRYEQRKRERVWWRRLLPRRAKSPSR
jgi:hypothetical protein